MNTFLKKNLTALIIVIATLILALISIFTAIKLYQLRQTPVAPNAPERPQAATSSACQAVSFTLTPTAVICTRKVAYKDVSSNTPGHYDLPVTNILQANTTVTPGQKIVYVITPGPTGVTKSITFTDQIPSGVTFLDSDNQCTYNSSNRTVTCTMASTNTQGAFRVSIDNTTTGNINNTATVTGSGDQPSTCSISLVVPVLGCYGSCTTPGSQSNCGSGMTCQTVNGNNICVNPSCSSSNTCVCAAATPTPSPTPTPVPQCGTSCTTPSDCTNGMACSGGACRNPLCVSSTSCVCATATLTPTNTPIGATPTITPITTATAQPTLPQTGVDAPTILGFAIAAFLILGSLVILL